MLKTKIYLKEINYNTLVDLMMPFIEKWLTEKDNIFYNIFSKMISNNGKPTKLSKFLVSVIPNKSNVAASILPHFNEVLIEYLNNLLIKNGIAVRITSIKIESIERRYETMLRIEINIDEIDYEKTIDNLLSVMIQRLSEKEDKSGKIGRLLLSLNGLPNQVLKAAIGAIPKEQRDELAASIISEYKEELADILNSIVSQNNIKAEISEINIHSI
ncbi:MAG: hypothetical protein PHF63_09675 [Herbinix sp.]|nr:hypothetical protein [Herbinix sp.]